MDVLDFQTKIANCNYNAAFKVFRNAVAFPEIVAALCPEYCASSCPRSELDAAVQLNLLERTCVARATKKDPIDYNVPEKNRKIGIIGGGISGLACAVRLTQKKYEVTIFEKTDRLGGKLWDLLPSELFLSDIERQLQFEKYNLYFNSEVKNLDELKKYEFEAIYVATGKNGNSFGALDQKEYCLLWEETAVFAGGSITGKDPIRGLADGLDMAWAIEVFLKTKKLEYPKEANPCRSAANPDKLIKTEPIIPTDNGLFKDAEVTAEASRCIRCQCDACMAYCDVCDYHNKWPMRIRDDIMSTVAFSTSESMLKKTPAKVLMNTCTQCGLCDEVCPEDIELGGMLLEAKRTLHKHGTLPGAFHQFWLRDMEFANSEQAAIIRKAPNRDTCSHVFFPGCQLGAAHPNYVWKPYQWLLEKIPDIGLMLRCCGIPAEWAGNEAQHNQEILAIKESWIEMGRPKFVFACPSCSLHLKEYLPEIESTSLYELMKNLHFPVAHCCLDFYACEQGRKTYTVFDPCSARNKQDIQEAVRALAVKGGLSISELPKGDKHGCCGYGGHGSIADKEFTSFVTGKRMELSENPYLSYCMNCRDIFREEGKESIHILDLLFHIDLEGKNPIDINQQRRNRVALKGLLLMDIWGEIMKTQKDICQYQLLISAEMRQKLHERKILEEDVYQVIAHGEKTKRRVYSEEKDTYSCYKEIGHITCWVEYRTYQEGYELINAYTHRMKIKLEGMWNGRKADIDL